MSQTGTGKTFGFVIVCFWQIYIYELCTNAYSKMPPHTNTFQFFFFCQGFFSRTMTTDKTAGEGRGTSFIPLYHFHPLTNIHTFILQLCMFDDYHIFLIAPLIFTRLLLDEIYHLIEYTHLEIQFRSVNYILALFFFFFFI